MNASPVSPPPAAPTPNRYTAEQNRILNNGRLVLLVNPVKVTDASMALAEQAAQFAAMQLMAVELGNQP